MNGLKHSKVIAGIAIVVTTLAAGLTQTASAESVVVRSIAVTYADLDLADAAGVQALYSRIVSAAESACGRYDVGDLRAKRDHKTCYEAAVAAAVAGVDNASLRVLHAEETGTLVERVAANRR